MNCTHCGASIPDNTKFCPKCGNVVETFSAADLDEAETSVLNQGSNPYNSERNSYGAGNGWADNQPQQQYAPPQQQYTPPQPVYPQTDMSDYQTVSVGGWIGVYFLSWLPLINLIMLFVWAFSGSTKPSLKNYAKAQLILILIGILLAIIIALLLMAFGVIRFK